MTSEFNSMEDLAFSRSFRNWVLNRDAGERSFWEHWIARNPDKAEMVKCAKAIIFALHGKSVVLSEDEIDEEVRKSVARLREAPRYIPLDGLERGTGRRRGLFRARRIWAVAASAAALGLGAWLYYRVHFQPDLLQSFLNSHKKEAMHQLVADETEEEAFSLPDESLVRLRKAGKLYYAADWTSPASRREVYLQGDADFDVRRNPASPFLVFTDQLVIKAVGTNFRVHSIPSDTRAAVSVARGSVSVYRREDFGYATAVGPEPPGMLLMPNQEGIYDRQTGRWQRTLVREPRQLKEKPDTALIFVRTPIHEVFGRLQELYGIPIQFDEEALARCSVTIRLGNESYYDHAYAICKAIGGNYEVIDGNVVVTAAAGQGRSGGGPER